MKFLSRKIHGIGDYAAAMVLIVAPFVLGLNETSAIAHWVSVAGGIGLIIYSLLTDYAFSIARVIPFRAHLVLDSLAGLALIVLAFALNLGGLAQVYMLAMGGGVLLVVAVSKTGGEATDGG